MLCALEAYHQGHDIVAILEKAHTFEVTGNTMSFLPPALSTLRYYAKMKEHYDDITFDSLFSLCRFEGRPLTPQPEGEWNSPAAVHSTKDVCIP
jgi:hypothetical protein